MLHVDTTSKNRSNVYDPDHPALIATNRPCSSIDTDVLPEVKSCCRLFDDIFRRSNIQQIMSLMKYSLDLSNPWISQYYHNYEEDEDMQTLRTTRDLYKGWLAEGDDELLKLLSTNGEINFLQGFG